MDNKPQRTKFGRLPVASYPYGWNCFTKFSGYRAASLLELKMKPAFLFLVTALAIPTVAGADQTLSFRGGIAGSLQQYPYAVASTAFPPTVDVVADSSYGIGGFASVAYGVSDLFNGYGLEASLSFTRLEGDDAFGEPAPGPGSCAPGIYDVLTLSHGSCMDGAEVTNTSISGQARLLGTRTLSATGTQVLAGFGVLSFQNDIDGMMIYPGDISRQSRDTDFLGAGIVFGARHNMPVSGTWTLGLEGFGGVFRGDHETRIRDSYNGAVGALDLNEVSNVYSLDLAASVERDVSAFGRPGSVEVGVSYNALFGAGNTANFGPFFASGNSSPTGSTRDTFDAISLFAGYTLTF